MNPEELLQQYYGYSKFRPGQKNAIDSVLQRRDALCVMPTGSGKSVCYQIPALSMQGLTLVISPLISLMKDQVSALSQQGIPAAFVNTSLSPEELRDTLRQVYRGEYRILYVAPERLLVPSFVRLCQQIEIPFVAVDEAHCISQWGQDFRPAYLKVPEFIHTLPTRPVVGAYTATATKRVSDDIVHFLELNDPIRIRTGFDRPNLSFTVLEPRDRDRELCRILRNRRDQSGIVYCPTRKRVEETVDLLLNEGFSATRYHAKLEPEERKRNQEDFLFDRKRVMVATNAFGMGIDKSNVSYVIHYGIPLSLEAYYQEAGRAGRDGSPADCILLYDSADFHTCRWMIEHSDPNPDLTPAEQREVTEKQQERLRDMTFYARSRRCLRQRILRYFGETAPDYCGNCSVCAGDVEHTDITTDAKKILSCVLRGKEALSADATADVLRGSVSDPMLQELTTFGIMRDVPREYILAEIRELEKLGLLHPDSQGLLKTDPPSRDVLFASRRVAIRGKDLSLPTRRSSSRAPFFRSAAPGAATEEPSLCAPSNINPDLLSALKYLRLKLSSAEKVAPFVLFSDTTLLELCRKMPSTQDDLLRVTGIGTFKANKYGPQLLSILNLYRKK